MKRRMTIGAAFLVLSAFAFSPAAFQAAPALEVDPLWPRPLPNHWLLGSVTGVAVDGQDHIWVVHRGYDSMTARTEIGAATHPKTADECCVPAPQVLEFDAAGTLVGHWGRPFDAAQGRPSDKYDWPVSPGGITVDATGHVWIAAAGPPEIPGSGRGSGRATAAAPSKPTDAHVLKFSRKGEFLLQIGKAGAPGGNDSTTALNRPAAVAVDATANEVYVADGFGNRRIVVFDATTGAYKRHWGGSGEKPADGTLPPYDAAGAPSAQFRSVGCVEIARDKTVYVCDRGNNRVQAFDQRGTLLKQGIVSKSTLGTGSVWDVALSNDAQQRYLFVADGHDQKVFILRRDTLETVGSFGGGGRYPGLFYSVGSVAVDSRGNVYTGETLEGKRVQKFMPKGGSR